MTTNVLPASYPLFRRYSVSKIAELTGYSEAYLLQVKQGNAGKPVTGKFKRKMAAALGETEETLFAVAK